MSQDAATPWVETGPVPYRIHGHDIQSVEFAVAVGARVLIQPNSFLCGAGGVDQLHVSWGRRLLDPVRRTWAGEQGVMQQVVGAERPARVVVGGAQFGKIIAVPVRPGRQLICQRGALLAATGEIDISVAFTRRLRVGLLGRQGVVFQRLSGDGEVFLHAAGMVVDWTIPDDSVVRSSTNNILAFEDSVGYDLQFSGGLMTLMFGGQGMFLSQLQGPGRVLIQSVDQNVLFKSVASSPKMFGEMRDAMVNAPGRPGGGS